MKVLLISYYFAPHGGVAAKRPTYWWEQLNEDGIDCEVITATEQTEQKEKITYLPCTNSPGLFIKDPGAYWKKDLKSYLIDNFDYDVVIFTGGPFLHFVLGKWLKENYGCRIILDYRDPFANNPRFYTESKLKKIIKKFFENRFNKYADKIIAVNEVCKNLIKQKEKVEVIRNGYDERVMKAIPDTEVEPGTIIYTGKIYDDFDINYFVQALSNLELSFNYYGSSDIKLTGQKARVFDHGEVPYVDMIKAIAKSDICVLFTGGKAFESPTKLYDYLGLQKKILVVTEREIKTGEIHEITSDYPNIRWVENNVKDIEKGLKELSKVKSANFDVSQFSRKKGVQQLKEIILA